jgi:hypothetical protein
LGGNFFSGLVEELRPIAKVHKEFFSGVMRLAHHYAEFFYPTTVVIVKLNQTIAVRMIRSVFFPTLSQS